MAWTPDIKGLLKKTAQTGAGIGVPVAALSAAGIPGLSTIGATTGLAALGQVSGLALLGLNPITAGLGAVVLLGGGSALLVGKAVDQLTKGQQKDINGQDEYGRTLLHGAAAEGQVDAVETLIALGADLNSKDNQGDTPLHRAAAELQVEAVKVLIGAEANLNSKNKQGHTPKDYAAAATPADCAGKANQTDILILFAEADEGAK